MKRRWSVLVALLFAALAGCSMIHGAGSAEGSTSAQNAGFVVGPTFHF